MPKYAVRFVKITDAVVYVEAEDEEEAAELAYDELPMPSAHETGWGSFGKWVADVGDWHYLDEFYGVDYSEEKYGPVIEEVENEAHAW